MKRILPLLILIALASTPLLAQQSGATNAPPAHPHPPGGQDGGRSGGGMGGMGPMAGLTSEERQELMKARMAAMQNNPDLQKQLQAVQEKIDAAMVKEDPNVAPIIAKMKAARQQMMGGPGGGPPPGGENGGKPSGKQGN